MLFPRFTSQTPSGVAANFYHDEDEPLLTIPIYRLCHVTHELEAYIIQSGSSFEFAPRLKLGKAYDNDGSPLGTTYKEISKNRYQKIPRSKDNPVFPGYLSWWGIDTREWLENDPDTMHTIQDYQRRKCYLHNYLAIPPESMYGNKAFSIKMEDILQDYKRSRADQKEKMLCLRGGGTLRYRNEICYVIMVCMEGDDVQGTFTLNDKPFRFDPTSIDPTSIDPTSIDPTSIDPTSMVNANGIIVDYKKPLNFTPQSIVKWHRGSYDWENLAFCFYFPSKDQRLTCTNVTVNDVKHDKCTASFPIEEKMICPNKLGIAKAY